MKRVLILTCGTNACYHIVKILKEKFNNDFYLVGTDINKKWLIPTCNYLDDFYQVPFTSDSSYYDCILDICKKEFIEFLIPSFDADQFLFYPENKDLLSLGIKSFGTPLKSLNFYIDKKNTNDYLNSLNIPVSKI